MLSAPRRMASAAPMREISVASASAGARSRLILEPARVGNPLTSNKFLTANGAPASGPKLSPRARAASIASAFSSARPAVTSVKAPSAPFRASTRASASRVISRALAAPVLIAFAIACAELSSSAAGVMA